MTEPTPDDLGPLILAHLHNLAQNSPGLTQVIALAEARAERDWWRNHNKNDETDDESD